jgi:hypothetical protein
MEHMQLASRIQPEHCSAAKLGTAKLAEAIAAK